MYDNPSHVAITFDQKYLSEYLLQAQWAEFIALKLIIHKLSTKLKRPIAILDIGIGDARIPKHLSGIKEIWDKISRYDGIDVAQNCIELSNQWIDQSNNQDRVKTYLLNANELTKLKQTYDLIICTWFTAGNFYPAGFDFDNFNHEQSMETNEKFSAVFSQAYQLLNPQGQIFIGSVYKDTDRTRKIQEEAYRHFNWTVITDRRDSFTATKEGWWSQRFTEQRILDYLHFVPPEKIGFQPLDTYEFAMTVEVSK